MSISTPPPARIASAQPESLEMRCWLLRDRPLIACLAMTCIVLTGATIYVVTGSLWGTVGGTTALIVAMRRVFLPIHFHLDPVGVTRIISGQRRRIPWSAIARYRAGRRGVVLFPYGADYRLAAGQGLFIPYAGYREQLLTMLAEQVIDDEG